MNNDQIAGTANTGLGRVEEAAGGAFNSNEMKSDGVIKQVKGAAQGFIGDAKNVVRDTYDRVAPAARDTVDRAVNITRQNSLVAILAAGAVGFALAVALRNHETPTQGSWSA